MLERIWRKRTLLHCWWECNLIQPLWRIVWRFLKKLKIDQPSDPAIPLGIYPEKTTIQNDTCIPIFTATLFSIARTWKQAKLSISRRIDKEDIAHIYNGILLSHKKEWNWVTCRDVSRPRDRHTEWSNSEREKQASYVNILSYIWGVYKNGKDDLCKTETEAQMKRKKCIDTKRGKEVVEWTEWLGLSYIYSWDYITVDSDCSHEIQRRLFLRRKAMTNLDCILKSTDITLPIKVHIKLWFLQ